MASVEREWEVSKNLEVAILSLRGAEFEEEKKAGCEAVAKAHEEVKRLEAGAPASSEVVMAGAWQAAGGVVTKKVVVVVRLNGPVDRERTAGICNNAFWDSGRILPNFAGLCGFSGFSAFQTRNPN